MFETTNHKFKNRKFYFPKWELDYLFIGTFNPEFGEDVPYYYGRSRNNFWKIISKIFKTTIAPYDDDFFKKLIEIKLGCVDLVDSVTYDKVLYHDKINGKGYDDKILFKKKNNIKKNYNTIEIVNLIKKNNLSKVYITNKGGVFLKEQKEELELIKNNCDVIYLPSPSPIHTNRVGIEKVISNWGVEIISNNKTPIFKHKEIH